MQLKIFTIPIQGGDAELNEMNAFLRGNKILGVLETAVVSPGGSWWSYSVRYLDGKTNRSVPRKKIDYREVLDETTFRGFSELRSRRKAIAKREGVPAYVIFTDAELAKIAENGDATDLSSLKAIEGIGPQKLAKYGTEILKSANDETGE